ncbi:MAG: asparagine synthase-related protein [Trueperaceae bacterium]
MSGIAAVLHRDGSVVAHEELAGMLPSLKLQGPDGTTGKHLGPAALACARFDTLPEDGPQPVTVEDVTVVADARIDNRSELITELRMTRTASDAAVVAAALARWHEQAPEHLEGDFAAIAWIAQQQKLLAFRDRFGVRPLFLAEAAGSLLLASNIDALLSHPSIPPDFNPDYFISYFATRRVVTELTPYKGVKRLERATILSVTPARSMRMSTYYTLEPTPASTSLAEAAEKVRSLLEQAVKDRVRAKRLSCEVSGGMDSTSVFALARRHIPELEARSMVSDRLPTMDERRYSRGLIGSSPWKQIRVDDLLSLEEFNAAHLFNEPVQELLLGRVRHALYEPFSHVQLSGHGGDALMTARYGLIRSQVRRGRLAQAWRDARAWGDSRDRAISRILRYALQRSMIPRVHFDWATRSAGRLAHSSACEIHAGSCSTGYTPEVSIFNLYNETGLIAPVQPVELRYPFLDRALVEYSLGLAPHLKSVGTMDKVVLRRAMSDLLPAEITTRVQKTGFDGIHGLSVSLNWPTIERWLRQPTLAELRVLSAEGLRNLAQGLRDGKSKMLTEAMIAISAEAWLQGRTADTPAHRQRQLAEEKFSLEMRGKEVQI